MAKERQWAKWKKKCGKMSGKLYKPCTGSGQSMFQPGDSLPLTEELSTVHGFREMSQVFYKSVVLVLWWRTLHPRVYRQNKLNLGTWWNIYMLYTHTLCIYNLILLFFKEGTRFKRPGSWVDLGRVGGEGKWESIRLKYIVCIHV